MLQDTMITAGNWLFRWRSFLPLAVLPALVWAVTQGEVIEHGGAPALGEAIEALALGLVIAGEVLRILTVGFVPRGTSGRNTDKGQIAERLNTTGLYSLVRNPLYLGNCLMYLGLVMFTQHLGLVVLVALALALYYERIIAAEEAFLRGRFGEAYASWAARTPAFWPKLTGWTAPDRTFSPRTVLRREHASILGAVVAVYLVELGLHRLPADADAMAPAWHWVVAGVLVADLAVVALKRWTRVLAVEGR